MLVHSINIRFFVSLTRLFNSVKEQKTEGTDAHNGINTAVSQTLLQEDGNQQQTVDIPVGHDGNPVDRENGQQRGKCEVPKRVFILLSLLYAAIFLDRGKTGAAQILRRLY